ncbi:MAG: Cell division protein ftsA [Parcubacteria group bacterium GW2011_GWB1_35_5]|uniref:Cell division protein FtsA n=1 Tax=Candidatus Zambryskibacteria bacterium RIFCSPLOWO2_01_FULL_35_19 TaxID=1802757 RepID=A0A1G2TXB4_9BACT|nr:MAG: Cell division protein ftsA [Parcubacteria group bacterium GW2011_GWC1_34_10]KKP80027.1 MAG: Cell division protein ftsA [Parcubacteria group bacterium GW2011_GWB1_35_5]OHA87623.1 MAG: cell division protein FtsA [Candidatus Zambryskibacteria bacterium RIFCSPHIGHO2_01_FULL_35_32]OHB01250.1 MAG: cell division protein FtsA [Candidatus Zambryskibacteria bacterium RIFCSPLOWO2_01_FULL_35_19]
MVLKWKDMSSHITAGIDIGTYEVRVVVAEQENENGLPKILGTGKAESKGLRHGYIINITDVTKSVSLAVRQAEKSSAVKIKKAFISIGGVGLSGINSQGSTIISRADQEITETDIEQTIVAAEEAIPKALIQNRKIIYSIPIAWKIDGKPVLGRVLGMKSVKLEAKTLFVSCIEPHLDDLVEAVEEAGIEVIDVVASPIAASFVTLSKSQKIAGCVLANIGAETVSIVVFENNIPISLEIFPIGGADITNDIALGLKISLEEAETIKLGGVTATNYPKKKLEEIISARLGDIFELIEVHLKKIGKSGVLPAGIIITGGSSSLGLIEDLARSYLRLPSRIASLEIGNSKFQIKDSSWSVAYGLCIISSIPDEEERLGLKKHSKNIFKSILQTLKHFLP